MQAFKSKHSIIISNKHGKVKEEETVKGKVDQDFGGHGRQ
jgi:hypothetical protein